MISPRASGASSPVHQRHPAHHSDRLARSSLEIISGPEASGRQPAFADEETIDEAMQRSVGEFGFGQQVFYVLAQLSGLPAALQIMVMVFTNIDPLAQRWFECVPVGEDGSTEACNTLLTSTAPDISREFCELPKGAYAWTRKEDSIVSQWDLVCDELWKQQAVNSAFFGGFTIGAGVFGTLSDRIGRKRALFIALVVGGVSGIFGGLVRSYGMHFFWRMLTGVGVGGIGMIGYVLGCEFVGPSWRGVLGVAAQYMFAIGATLLPAIAFYMPSWRALSIFSGCSSLAYLLVWVVIPESPRWLLVMGRKGDATAVLARMTRWNGTKMSTAPLADIFVDNGSSQGVGTVLWHPILRNRLLVQLFSWFSCSVTYYGISLMVADLPGSIYSNNAILAVADVPSYLLSSILVDRLGRRVTISGSFLLGGISLLLSAFTSDPWSLYFAFLAKFGIAAAFALVYLYAAELFPTVVRNVCIGTSSQFARIGGMVTPVIIMTAHAMHAPLLGFLVMGALSLIAGLLLLTQPETLGTELPDTIEDVGFESHSSGAACCTGSSIVLLVRQRLGWERLGSRDLEGTSQDIM